MLKIGIRLVPALIIASASTAAFAETVLDLSSGATERRSLTQMAVECDGQPRGPCFLKLLAANKKIGDQYFDRYLKGASGSSPSYRARYKEMEAARKTELNGITRAELLRRAAAIK